MEETCVLARFKCPELNGKIARQLVNLFFRLAKTWVVGRVSALLDAEEDGLHLHGALRIEKEVVIIPTIVRTKKIKGVVVSYPCVIDVIAFLVAAKVLLLAPLDGASSLSKDLIGRLVPVLVPLQVSDVEISVQLARDLFRQGPSPRGSPENMEKLEVHLPETVIEVLLGSLGVES